MVAQNAAAADANLERALAEVDAQAGGAPAPAPTEPEPLFDWSAPFDAPFEQQTALAD
jgi:hypothetical protein